MCDESVGLALTGRAGLALDVGPGGGGQGRGQLLPVLGGQLAGHVDHAAVAAADREPPLVTLPLVLGLRLLAKLLDQRVQHLCELPGVGLLRPAGDLLVQSRPDLRVGQAAHRRGRGLQMTEGGGTRIERRGEPRAASAHPRHADLRRGRAVAQAEFVPQPGSGSDLPVLDVAIDPVKDLHTSQPLSGRLQLDPTQLPHLIAELGRRGQAQVSRGRRRQLSLRLFEHKFDSSRALRHFSTVLSSHPPEIRRYRALLLRGLREI